MTTPRRTIRVSDREWAAWVTAAGGNVSDWIRRTCNQAASAPPCHHPRKQTGASGLLKCRDCGEVLR